MTTAKTAVETMQFEPLEKQKIFSYLVLEDKTAKFTWYCGGFGSGKSFIGSQIANRLVAQCPMGRGLIARQTAVDLKATTMKTFWEVTDARAVHKHNKSESLITFKNGHEVYYWGLDDIEKLKSLEIGWFWIDEVNEVPEETFNVLKGRLRHKLQPKRVGFITSNSEGKNWSYQQFIKGKGIRNKKDLEKYYVVKAPSNENIHLPEDYLETLNSYTGDLYQRYVLASFNVFEGQIFTEITPSVHYVKPFAIPGDWKKIVSIDHGERSPTAFNWGAISPEGDVYIYREYSVPNEFVQNHVKALVEMTGEEEIDYYVIDPSTKSTRGASGKKIDKEYKDEFYRLTARRMRLRYGRNNVQAGIAKLHKYLQVDASRIHPETKKKGAPRLFFFNNLETTLEELESYRWKTQSHTSEEDPPEEPRKKDDHNVDGVRYLIMEQPDISIGKVHSKIIQERENRGKDNDVHHDHDYKILKNAKKQYNSDFLI